MALACHWEVPIAVTRARTVVALVLLAVGVVWIAQGTGALQGSSFMVGDARWAVAGGVCIALGMVLLLAGRIVPRR
jgi:hypothetical protein